jgi:hypothetical protein
MRLFLLTAKSAFNVLILASTMLASNSPAATTQTTRPGDGIPCYRRTTIDYRHEGKPALRIELGEPVIVAVASKLEKWGFYQFPGVTRWEDGRLCVSWHMAQDSALAYGSASGAAVSKDEGRTWAPYVGPWGVSGLLLPNGDRIAVTTPKSRKVSELKLPEPVGVVVSTYGKAEKPMYRLAELPADLQVVHIKRLPKGRKASVAEQSRLDDPQALRYSTQGVFPIVWWGDLRVSPDGSILAGIYPGYRLRDDGTMDPKDNVFFYRSTDNGHTWQIQGRILYQPDLATDPKGDDRIGFTEPTFDILPGGVCLCVMRTTDGVGIGPMYASRSTDLGKTWTRPKVIARSGVLPRLLRLANGVIVLSSGRPGVQVRFCTDVKGKVWTDAFEMLARQGDADTVSCGYTALLATGPDRFLLAYSDFRHTNEAGQQRKAIKVREIIVSPQ